MNSREAQLNTLIEQQANDRKSRYVSKDARESNFEYKALIELSDSLQSKKDADSRISWGKPAKIAACRDSNACGVCRNRTAQYSDGNTALIAGVDFARDKGEIVGACCDCGFSFGFNQSLEKEDQ